MTSPSIQVSLGDVAATLALVAVAVAVSFWRRADLELHLIAQFPVEGTEWLIHQEHRRPEHEGPGQGDALLLAAAELLDPAVAERSQLHKG